MAKELGPIGVCLVTVSDTRTEETDLNGKYLRSEIEALGHRVDGYRIIKDEPNQVAAVLDDFASTNCRLILFNGGTGISPRDTTYDVLSRKLEKTLPGFGELFRMFSYEAVGAAAMLSRAAPSIVNLSIVALPASVVLPASRKVTS